MTDSRALRDILLAHAIETSAPNDALPSTARCEAISQETLHALGQPKGQGAAAGRAQFFAFITQRAARIIQASQLPPEIREIWKHAPGLARWVPYVVVLGALVLGFAMHRITDPHRVDLLAPSLLGLVFWNLLVYLWIFAAWLLSLFKRAPRVPVTLEPTQQGIPTETPVVAAGGWRQKLRGSFKLQGAAGGLRKMALTFERNWWRLTRDARHAQAIMWLHLGAAMMAVGALASLWMTGLTNEYQVGWESTFLSASTVQHLLNTLFAPLQWWFHTPPWSLQEIQSLQGWVSSQTPAPGTNPNAQIQLKVGERWVVSYTALLVLIVVAPRLLLALWQGVRCWWLDRHVQLPLTQPYFQKLQRDFGGLAVQLRVLPYSFEVTPERRAELERYVAREYGAGAHLQIDAPMAYGAGVPTSLSASDSAPVLLINMAATPEVEIHGELLNVMHTRWPAQPQVWFWSSDFAARNSGAPRRVDERRALWSEFARDAGLRAVWVP